MADGSAPGDERWGREFHAPNFNDPSPNDGTVNAVSFTTNGDLICVGEFSSVARVSGTRNIARWDGTNWWSVGGGISNATLYAVLAVGNEIIVGGDFASIQGQNITNLARWNGTNWSAIGGGVNGGSVRCLAFHNGALVVGGLFTSAGGNTTGYIANWDGASWTSLGGGVQASNPSSSAVPIQSLLSLNGALYAGGRFLSAGGVSANNIARWNGTAWESLGSGANNGVDDNVSALTGSAGGLLYVGGKFVNAGTNTVNYVTSWNGATWSSLAGGVSLPSPIPEVRSLLISGTDLYVSGAFRQAGSDLVGGMARWDGAAWHAVNPPLRHPGTGQGFWLAGHGSRIVAYATLDNVMTKISMKGLVQFDGQSWSIVGGGLVGGGNQPRISTVAVSNGKVQVSGFFDVYDGNSCCTMVSEWNGRGWNDLGNGLSVAFVDAQYFIHDFFSVNGITYAAGQFLGGANGVAMLTNNVWTDIGAPLSGVGLALAHYHGELFAGHGNGISRWSGGVWTNVGTGLNGAVNALIVLGAQLYAGGAFTNSGTTALNNIARWDGTNWFPLGTGVNSSVSTLAAWQDGLYVGGSFTAAGSSGAFRVARWKESGWTSLGAGFSDGVYPGPSITNDSLTQVSKLVALSDGRLFAAGNFTHSGSNLVNFIASWNGTNWDPLGSGVDQPILSMATDDSALYVGGTFYTAGGVSSLRMARWSIPPSFRVSLALPWNGPQVPLQITGEPGSSFAVETSTDLAQWTPITTNILTASPTQLTVSTNGLPKLFFRVRRIP